MTPIEQPLITPLFQRPSTKSMSMQTTSSQNLLSYHYKSTYMWKFLVWEQHNLFGHKYLKTVQILLDQIIRKILNKTVCEVSFDTHCTFRNRICIVPKNAQNMYRNSLRIDNFYIKWKTQPLTMELVIKTSNTQTSFYHSGLGLYVRLTWITGLLELALHECLSARST